MTGFRQDLKFALRTLARNPGFAVIAVLTLAIGIGANAAIYGVVDGVLLRPLPYGDSDRIVTIWSRWRGFEKTWVSAAEYQAYVSMNESLEDVAYWMQTGVTFTTPNDAERVNAAATTPNFTDVFGVEMAAGRYFTEDEARDEASNVVVLSHAAWVRRHDGDPGIVGRLVEVNGQTQEVVGVLPPGFRLPTDFGSGSITDLYLPLWTPREVPSAFPPNGGSHSAYAAGRLKEGVSVDQAQADLLRVIDHVGTEFGPYPPERNFQTLVFGVQDDVLGSLRAAVLALLGTVGFVLLIACANVANLLLARSGSRAGEMAVRASLGAGRGRIVRQLLTESVVLAGIGGVLGLVMAQGAIVGLKALDPGGLPRIAEVSLDASVVVFCLLLTGLTVLLFGALPALRQAGSDLQSDLGRRGAGGPGRGGWQGALVAVEVAMAVVLVVGAGLMAQTFRELSAIDMGFGRPDVLTMAISLPGQNYPDAEAAMAFHREAMRGLSGLPGVERVSGARILPLASPIGDWGVTIEAYEAPPDLPVNGDWQYAAPGYFEVMGITLRAGRTFTEADDETAPGVAVVNEAFVRHFWPNGQDPIGRRFSMNVGSEPTWMTIVGVVGNVTHNGITAEVKRKFYFPMAQWNMASGFIPSTLRYTVQASASVSSVAGPAREVIRALDPSLAVSEVQTLEDIQRASVAQPRFTVLLMGAFSLIAIVLAAIGIYGVVAYGVSQRIQEIGVRMALGAERGSIVGQQFRRGSGMVAVGLAGGIVAALLLSRFVSTLLYGVSATDAATYVAVAGVFALVAGLATWIPARRAARIDPIRALRAE